jgi:hypothetical protein
VILKPFNRLPGNDPATNQVLVTVLRKLLPKGCNGAELTLPSCGVIYFFKIFSKGIFKMLLFFWFTNSPQPAEYFVAEQNEI